MSQKQANAGTVKEPGKFLKAGITKLALSTRSVRSAKVLENQMENRALVLYDKCKNDHEFLEAIKTADGDNPPDIDASTNDKVVYAAVYYGYLVGKNGPDNWDCEL